MLNENLVNDLARAWCSLLKINAHTLFFDDDMVMCQPEANSSHGVMILASMDYDSAKWRYKIPISFIDPDPFSRRTSSYFNEDEAIKHLKRIKPFLNFV